MYDLCLPVPDLFKVVLYASSILYGTCSLPGVFPVLGASWVPHQPGLTGIPGVF